MSSSSSNASAIDVLKPEHRKSAVYRLVGAGDEGENIIAKLCSQRTAQIEDTVYRRVLAPIGGASARYYGMIEASEDERVWLFVGDLGDTRFSLGDPDHRRAAAVWMARLHLEPVDDQTQAMLPARGPFEYAEVLRAAHEAVITGLANPALSTDDADVLQDIAHYCRQLESRRSMIDDVCDSLPSTLVHGDLGAKNARMITREERLTFMPFDWETSGWGCAAIDLSVVDLPAYAAVLSESRAFDTHSLANAACLGRVFWCLAPIRGETASLTAGWVDGIMTKMRFYRAQIAAAMAGIQ